MPTPDENAVPIAIEDMDDATVREVRQIVNKEVERRCKAWFDQICVPNNVTELERAVIAMMVARIKQRKIERKLLDLNKRVNELRDPEAAGERHGTCHVIADHLVEFCAKFGG